jgi:hypothetical protein
VTAVVSDVERGVSETTSGELLDEKSMRSGGCATMLTLRTSKRVTLVQRF